MEVGERSGSLQLRAVTGPGGSQRRWRIGVTQYGRRADGAAPPGCLQYHTGRLGTIESFNYPTAAGDGAGYLVHGDAAEGDGRWHRDGEGAPRSRGGWDMA